MANPALLLLLLFSWAVQARQKARHGTRQALWNRRKTSP